MLNKKLILLLPFFTISFLNAAERTPAQKALDNLIGKAVLAAKKPEGTVLKKMAQSAFLEIDPKEQTLDDKKKIVRLVAGVKSGEESEDLIKQYTTKSTGGECDINEVVKKIDGLDAAFKSKISAAKDDQAKANLIVALFSDKDLSGYKAIEAAKAKGADLDAISKGISDAINTIKSKK